MSGTELTVGGWFASSIIRNTIDVARSYLGDNYALHSATREMLTSLENSLLRIQTVIEVASKRPTTNSGLIKWMDNMKNAAYEVKDVLDDLEARRFRECLKDKNKITEVISSLGKLVKTMIFPDKELKGFKTAVEKFYNISKEGESLLNVLDHEIRANAHKENTSDYRRETSSYLDPNTKIFGRDMEIYYILDMILNYRSMCFSKASSNQKLESQSELPNQKEITLTSSILGYRIILEKIQRAFEKGNTSQVKKEGKDQEKSNIQSSAGYRNTVSIKNWKLPVLSICGLGGVGKTTIAKIVYNNDIVNDCFDLKAWVYVPEEFDIRIIMEKILDLLMGSGSFSRKNDRELIEIKLKLTIENRRVFLVLDDVHDRIESIWSDLFSVLSNGAPGSFILATTQSKHIAKTIGNMSININLDALETEWFDLVFKSYAFGELFSFDQKSGIYSISCTNNAAVAQFSNLRDEELSVLESIASEIAKKLHGLPLAGRVIGKMLYTKLEKVHWEKILKSDWWEWEDKNISQEIIASLSIGYKDLDPDVQQCFKFCSVFPKHYVFDKHILVQMWLAHDFEFVQSNEGESFKLNSKEIKLEDIGGERFDKLVERSFFQATVNDGKYVMHDLIRELAIAVSRNEEFYYVNHLDNKISNVITRHMGINCNGSDEEEISPICRNLRTMILFGNWIKYSGESIRNIFGKSNGLRLLDLSYIGIEKNAPFDAICRQSHLRFVDLSFSGIDFIPDIFCELYHLQVLDVRGCNFRKLPKGMNKLINLRHLYASAETLSLIFGIGKLTNLQELKEFRIGESNGHKISELRDMNEISGHLLLTNLKNVSSKEEAATCQLAKKSYLKSLELTFSYTFIEFFHRNGRLDLEILEALKPSPSVEMLTIRGSGGDSLPGWMWSTQSGFSNLKCIVVSECQLTSFPAFGELPSLEVLRFMNQHKRIEFGDEFYGRSHEVFPSLKELEFSSMHDWWTWSDAPAGKKSFPVLKRICLHCSNLMEMPTNVFTSSVVQLTLHRARKINNIETVLQRMPQLTSLRIYTSHNDLSIYCTGLRFLEVLHLTAPHVCFVGGLKSLVNLRKLELSWFCEIIEKFEEEEENDGTCQENQFLTSLNLDYPGILPLAGRLGYLRSLLIRNSPVKEYTEEEGSWFTQLTSLETLVFVGCSKLRGLPSTLPSLTKLKKLTILDCPHISSLPEFGLPPSLTELYITGCSDELVSRCQPDQGDDWWKISHIPDVQIDDNSYFTFSRRDRMRRLYQPNT